MANVTVVSYHNGGMPRDMEGNTPAELARVMDISLSGVKVYVDDDEVKTSKHLADGDIVSFQRSKVSSGY